VIVPLCFPDVPNEGGRLNAMLEGLMQCLTVIKQVTATLAGAGQSNVWYVWSRRWVADSSLNQYGFAQADFYKA
jgi:hypothetical protein